MKTIWFLVNDNHGAPGDEIIESGVLGDDPITLHTLNTYALEQPVQLQAGVHYAVVCDARTGKPAKILEFADQAEMDAFFKKH